jgi:ankyrin repeat protein
LGQTALFKDWLPTAFMCRSETSVHLQAVKYDCGDNSILHIDTLVLAGADVNGVCTRERRTALMWVCAQGKADMACRLVEHSVSYKCDSVDNETCGRIYNPSNCKIDSATHALCTRR